MNVIPWSPIRSSLAEHFSFSDIKIIAGYAGVNLIALAHLEQTAKAGATKSQLLSEIDKQLENFDEAALGKIAAICCEEILSRKPQLIGDLERVLSRVGWKYSETNLIPIAIFDLEEFNNLPQESHVDIGKASAKLRDGDLSGALASVCGALDSTTSSIYRSFNLGKPEDDSFQTRVNRSLTAVGTADELKSSLEITGWSEAEANILTKNLIGSLNQAAYVLQKLRSDMSDVHGTKKVIPALVYSSIKWATLILRFFKP